MTTNSASASLDGAFAGGAGSGVLSRRTVRSGRVAAASGTEWEKISFASPGASLPPAALPMNAPAHLSLNQLPDGTLATVQRVVAASRDIDAVALRRLGELGFLPGEPVQVLRRGPGGREPVAVLIGETMFALRLLEAQCIEVVPAVPTAAVAEAGAEESPPRRSEASAEAR